MKLKTVIVTIEEDAIAGLKKIEGVAEAVVVSATQLFVAKLKALPIATAAMNTIELLEETGKSGAEKFSELVTKEGPQLKAAVQEMGGLKEVGVTLESLGEEYFNSLVNDFKAVVAKV